MATLRLLLVAALLALPLWAAQTVPAHACSVASAPTLAEQVAYADLIAIGTIEEVLVLPPESVAHPETLAGSGIPVEMKFRVTEYLKATSPNPTLIYSPAYLISYDSGNIASFLSHDSSCGSHYSLGMSYVMFMTKNDSLRYTPTGLYGGTTPVSDDQQAADYIAQIRAAVIAEQIGLPDTGSRPAHHDAPIVPLMAAFALAAIGLAANAAFALRRRS